METVKTNFEQIFDIVESIGETITGTIHIIDTSENVDFYEEGEREYRVYSQTGYCFDITKLIEEYTDDTETEVKTFYYSFYQEWEGFIKVEPTHIMADLRYIKALKDNR